MCNSDMILDILELLGLCINGVERLNLKVAVSLNGCLWKKGCGGGVKLN